MFKFQNFTARYKKPLEVQSDSECELEEFLKVHQGENKLHAWGTLPYSQAPEDKIWGADNDNFVVWFLGCPVWSQEELDSMTLMSPFQFGIFCDSTT